MFHLRVNDSLELRLLTEAHTTALFTLINRNREALRPWLPWVDGTRSLEDTRRFIRFGLRQHARRSGMHAGLWVDNHLGGVISYNYINQGKQMTEIGYWLGESFQGRGLMTAACRAMTSYAFTHLGLQTVEIRCAADNLKSRHVAERLGFHYQGSRPQLDWQAERYIDTMIYSMTGAEWSPAQEDRHDSGSHRRGQL
jgi:ribosomal-protein-serine acetyltransferase